jgi:hypothetical protein
MLERDGIRKIVSNFADARVGSVSSGGQFIGRDGKASGEGAYVKYEMWLRSLETRVNSGRRPERLVLRGKENGMRRLAR